MIKNAQCVVHAGRRAGTSTRYHGSPLHGVYNEETQEIVKYLKNREIKGPVLEWKPVMTNNIHSTDL